MFIFPSVFRRSPTLLAEVCLLGGKTEKIIGGARFFHSTVLSVGFLFVSQVYWDQFSSSLTILKHKNMWGGKHDLMNIMEFKKKRSKNWLRYYVFIRMSFILCILAFLSIAVSKIQRCALARSWHRIDCSLYKWTIS